ncbi:hypothetical protein GOV04_02260 [Candidatus Woesearchaeota archaeon]|nr:hypothetical protein [Candidatus Woesearchaeota archaeon]
MGHHDTDCDSPRFRSDPSIYAGAGGLNRDTIKTFYDRCTDCGAKTEFKVSWGDLNTFERLCVNCREKK